MRIKMGIIGKIKQNCWEEQQVNLQAELYSSLFILPVGFLNYNHKSTMRTCYKSNRVLFHGCDQDHSKE